MNVMNETDTALAQPRDPSYGRLRLVRHVRRELPGKRGLDIVLALVGLIAASPLLLLIAVCIKLENPRGRVLFVQQRLGRGGQPFDMYKFRSMIENAEARLDELLRHNEVSGAMFKIRNDPRVTRIGRILRKTSLDELPQLWNVLRGEMSLVGPRPPLPREAEQYTEIQWRRLAVTPGCTGLWQVSGRSTLGFERMVELDLEYIEKRGLWLDLKILARTVKVLFGSRDAF